MVQNAAADAEVEVDLEARLSTAWQAMMGTQSSAVAFIAESQKKDLGGSLGQAAFFNNKLDINRFFIEEGEGDNAPQVFFSKNDQNGEATNAGGEQPSQTDDLFEGELDSALQVFKSGGANTDLLKENEGQILFYVDLENEEVIGKEQMEDNKDEDDDGEREIGERPHPVLFNQYPLCEAHSLLLLFAEHSFPQVLSNELIQLLLQIFKLSQQPSLRLGYNSMGADCIINNLHFHVMQVDKLFGEGVEQFPIEQADKQLFFKTSLKHKAEGEIDMFNCGVRFGELVGWPLRTLLLSPHIEDDNTELEDAQEALAHAAGVVLNHLIEANIPHNILVADEGMTLYIIPRKFDMLIENVQFFTSFESLCGFVKFKNEQAYQTMDWAQVSEALSSQVSMGAEEFNLLKSTIVNKFMSEYQGEWIGGPSAEAAQVQVAVENMKLQ